MGDRDRSDPLLTRRAFLGLLGPSAGVIVLGGLVRFVAPPKRFIRPPGAAREDEFLALCTRCLKCMDVCPNIIAPVSLAESVTAVGTPKVIYSCPHCMRCNYVCPTGALTWGR